MLAVDESLPSVPLRSLTSGSWSSPSPGKEFKLLELYSRFGRLGEDRTDSECEMFCKVENAVAGSGEKNRTMNVNSADAASRRTRRRDRKRASTGCL